MMLWIIAYILLAAVILLEERRIYQGRKLIRHYQKLTKLHYNQMYGAGSAIKEPLPWKVTIHDSEELPPHP
jgi:hypothetical protein